MEFCSWKYLFSVCYQGVKGIAYEKILPKYHISQYFGAPEIPHIHHLRSSKPAAKPILSDSEGQHQNESEGQAALRK